MSFKQLVEYAYSLFSSLFSRKLVSNIIWQGDASPPRTHLCTTRIRFQTNPTPCIPLYDCPLLLGVCTPYIIPGSLALHTRMSPKRHLHGFSLLHSLPHAQPTDTLTTLCATCRKEPHLRLRCLQNVNRPIFTATAAIAICLYCRLV